MYAPAIIVFRESLEAAWITGIMLAATPGIAIRGRWVLGGVCVGLAGAVLVASAMEQIANPVGGMGQEFFNAAVLLTAIAMLAWHNIWMAAHGQELAQQMERRARRHGRSQRTFGHPPGDCAGRHAGRLGNRVVSPWRGHSGQVRRPR